MKKRIALLLGWMLLWSAGSAETLRPDENAAHITRTLVRRMPQAHMNHDPLSESLARRTFDNY